MLNYLFNASRTTKRSITITYDILAITLSLYLSLSLRYGELAIELDIPIISSFACTMIITLALMIKTGLYRAILRYAPIETLFTIALATAFSAITLACCSFFMKADVPRSSPIIYLLASTILLGAPRILIRNLVQFSQQGLRRVNGASIKEPVIIYGAGYSGYQLAQNLNNDLKYTVKAFVDDDKRLWGNKLKRITVSSPDQLLALSERHNAKTVLLALGNSSRAQRNNIINRVEQAHLKAQTIPPVNDILTGKAQISDLKPVAIEDLLGRDPVVANEDLLHAGITNKNVMVTGAGGSIGSELCRQILRQNPSRLVLFEQNEYSLYAIEQELQKSITLHKSKTELVSIIGSVQNRSKLETTLVNLRVQTIYHTAAYKHVPLVEHNIIEGVRNNIFGTWHCAEAAIRANVDSFVLISTDKAVRPTNIMGATKRVAELILQGLAQRQDTTRFTMVRFGNVLGSSGSVVPLFRKQIQNGGPITLTHPDIIRYFMTIPEAAELVIQAGAMGQGGDVFVLDMGEPVKIMDLAIRMIHLSGMSEKTNDYPNGDIEIKITGLRSGEKLYEELLIGDNVSGTSHPRIMRAEEKRLDWANTDLLLQKLDNACEKHQCDRVKNLLLEAPTDYETNVEIEDWIWINDEKRRNRSEENIAPLFKLQ